MEMAEENSIRGKGISLQRAGGTNLFPGQVGADDLGSELILLLTMLGELQSKYQIEVIEISIKNIGGNDVVLR